jgi:hypothetical protein
MDLMTSDSRAAEDFYTQVADWGTDVWEGGAMPYTMFTAAERPIGGVMELPEEARTQGAPNHWLAYVAVPDVEKTVARATQLGGQVLKEPTAIPTVGKFAVLADPQSAVFAVFTAEGDVPGHDGPPAQGEFSWHELATTNYEAAFEFYSDLFGWQKAEAMDMGDAGTYQMYGRGEFPLGGMFNKPAELPFSAWLHYIRVADVNQAAEHVQRLGGQVLNGPMEVPGGDTIAQCVDPQGAAFALHSTVSGG